MSRQVRSEATRRKILDAAIEVFGEVGYAAAGWGAIIERTGMTKGALYHHFDSKESLASDILTEGSDSLLTAFGNVCGSSSPGLENLLHGAFTIVEVLNSDKTVRIAEQLASALSGLNEAAASFYADLAAKIADEARRAIREGDLRQDVDPEVLSEFLVGAMFGTRLVFNAIARHDANRAVAGDIAGRLRQILELLLPGTVTEASLPYFRQFLGREVMRHAPAIAARTDTATEP
ncbi:TetR/AcrR family transcriptional regulator [Mycobacterium nebraskense]|uniref:Spore coat protein CotS n=1 Tax=Mycobacterium nebraskense TaxID=244292 RepID=A0A0F5NBX6_9MYCO|nr:TetR/AcrR family transcriptional regulator [Mycobacterium nebraskense]KKC04551.1 spore coat protein CotS [Mycobacterium nebraskense]KLO35574.1 spore coat protein CotS [Mycobacterium nebraskense]MBI2693195.1 TetR/AcrR family transcriptional regulator [Mycobacterium nebraskense]MCV7116972.1 TetR/AcrR family transcriptional regulator [Mycobacterium nebraskense]ORW15845.1 spore coat protein CotS [Mycobacterium nebraskense]